MTWDGTSKSVSDALRRFSAGQPTPDDWSLMTDVVGTAMSARELCARLERLELAAGNESKRMRTQVDALKAESEVLAAKLKEHGL